MTRNINIGFFHIVLILILASTQTVSFAESHQQTQVGRYLSVPDKPLPEQENLMLQTVQVHFPPEVNTVGDAINYLLKPSGYTLLPMDKTSSEVKKMFAFGLPLVDRDFGPMTLQQALRTLAGDSFNLKIDRLNRQVSFHVRNYT